MKEYNIKLTSQDFDFNYFSAKAHLIFNYNYYNEIFFKAYNGQIYVIDDGDTIADGDIIAHFSDESDFSAWLQETYWDELMDDYDGKISKMIADLADEAFWKAHPEVLANIEI